MGSHQNKNKEESVSQMRPAVIGAVVGAVIGAIIYAGSGWIMRGCDRQQASADKKDDKIERRLDDLGSQVTEVSRNLASLDGQVKILSQLIAAPKGTALSFYVPSQQ